MVLLKDLEEVDLFARGEHLRVDDLLEVRVQTIREVAHRFDAREEDAEGLDGCEEVEGTKRST